MIGNLVWLVHVLAVGKLDAPRDHLLHYPVPAEPIPGFEELVRAELSNLVRQY